MAKKNKVQVVPGPPGPAGMMGMNGEPGPTAIPCRVSFDRWATTYSAITIVSQVEGLVPEVLILKWDGAEFTLCTERPLELRWVS